MWPKKKSKMQAMVPAGQPKPINWDGRRAPKCYGVYLVYADFGGGWKLFRAEDKQEDVLSTVAVLRRDKYPDQAMPVEIVYQPLGGGQQIDYYEARLDAPVL